MTQLHHLTVNAYFYFDSHLKWLVFWWRHVFFPSSVSMCIRAHAIRAARASGFRISLKCLCPLFCFLLCSLYRECLERKYEWSSHKSPSYAERKGNIEHTRSHECMHEPTHLDSDGEEMQQRSEKPSVTSEIRTWSLHQSTDEQSLGLAAKVSFTSSSQCGKRQRPLLVYALIFYHSKLCP